MELNVQEWKNFKICSLFEMIRGKTLSADDKEIYIGDIPCINGSAENNGELCKLNINADLPLVGAPALSLSRVGNSGMTFFQPKDFFIADNAFGLKLKYEEKKEYYLFLSSILNQELFKYSYGRTISSKKYAETLIKLPIQHNKDGSAVIDENRTYSDEGYIPDWKYMEEYIKSLHCKPITTAVAVDSSLDLNIEKWEEFKVSDIFEVKYGINMELNTCDETTSNDPEGIAFVARTADNNGVSAYVKRIDGKEPQPAETITVAGGGSVLSTFVQKRPFYSGRDLYLLLPKEDINLNVKIFIATVLYSNQYRYSYGRQANKTLPSLLLKLPIQRNGDGNPIIDEKKKYSPKGFIPDWKFMDEYIKSLPYSDRI